MMLDASEKMLASMQRMRERGVHDKYQPRIQGGRFTPLLRSYEGGR